MKLLPLLAATTIAATPVLGEDTRQLEAHEHGVGQLNIAFEAGQVAMEFHAPGADIVGFEHRAESSADRAAVDAAVAMLARPLDLFVLPDAAGCSVAKAAAALESEEEDHDDHAKDGHDEHEDEGGHTEFHAEYLLICADPSAVTTINFAYFNSFPNAWEVEVQLISEAGAAGFEVERDAPILDLRGMF